MKIALIKTKSQEPKYQQVINNNQQQEKDRETETEKKKKREIRISIGTHLTVSGVCTTISPENSGT
jgi:hypothetical protein